ncbi:MAG: PQQ-binding-like beta-propeller repeat protein, partial [Treponema sp.]|nr:PQQ-binding-like beta-propeller repeat protein [Treponema sp.]
MKNFCIVPFVLLTAAASLFGQRSAEPPVSARPIWEQDLRGTVAGLPFLQAESAVVALAEGDVKSYSRQGNWLWTFRAGEGLTPHVSRAKEGTTYICTLGGAVIAINRVGRELWRLNLGAPVTAPIVIGWDGRLFIPVGSKIYCRTASGYSLWMKDLGSPIFVKPVLDHRGGLALVLENNEFVLINHVSALERYRLSSLPLHIVPLQITEGEDSFYLFYQNGGIERIFRDKPGPEGIKPLKSESLPALSQTPAAAADFRDQVAVTLQDGSVQLLSVPDARVLWTEAGHEARAQGGTGNLEPYWAAMQFDER